LFDTLNQIFCPTFYDFQLMNMIFRSRIIAVIRRRSSIK